MLIAGRLVKLKKQAPYCAPRGDMRLMWHQMDKNNRPWWALEVPGCMFGAFLPESALKYSDWRYYQQR